MFEERFARQYPFEPPPGFRLASPYTSIVRGLSGPNMCALTQIYPNEFSRSVDGAGTATRAPPCHLSRLRSLHFHFASRVFATQALAHMLDSLVRVTRRVDGRHFVSDLEMRWWLDARSTDGWNGSAHNTLSTPPAARGRTTTPTSKGPHLHARSSASVDTGGSPPRQAITLPGQRKHRPHSHLPSALLPP